MSDLLKEAEHIKLARTLDVPPASLRCVEALGALEIRALRERITHLLFDQHRALFQRLAAAGRLVPARVSAAISQKAFGPLIAARLAGLLPPEQAVRIAALLPVGFLADLCLALDPRSAPAVLQRIPVRTVVNVAQELANRGEHVTMARFVDVLSDVSIQAVATALRDEAALVQIAFYVESDQRLDRLVELLPDERLGRLLEAAAGGPITLRQAAVSLLCRIGDRQKGRMGDAAVARGDKVMATLIGQIGRENAREVLPKVLANMKPAGRRTAEALLRQ